MGGTRSTDCAYGVCFPHFFSRFFAKQLDKIFLPRYTD
jgi:hypothetical protein